MAKKRSPRKANAPDGGHALLQAVLADARPTLTTAATGRYDQPSHQERIMRSVKIAVTIDQELLAQLDQLVKENGFPNRSRAVQP